MMVKTFLALGVMLVLTAAVAAESGVTTETAQADGKYRIGAGDRLAIGFTAEPTRGARTIVPGDRLSVSYHFGIAAPGEPYRLQPGDKVALYFKYSPVVERVYLYPNEDSYQPLSGATIVQPDGTLVLRAIDRPIMVADRTTSEVTTAIEQIYKKNGVLEHPNVNVTVEPQYEKEKTLREMFRTASGEGSPFMKVTVAPDGGIGLPLISGISTENKTAAQLSAELTSRYHKLGYGRVTVSAWLDSETDPRLEELRAMTGATGPLRARVLSGGEISLPVIHTCAALGKSPAQLARELTGRYGEMGYRGVRVTVWIEEAATR